jgi:hypothetical protein
MTVFVSNPVAAIVHVAPSALPLHRHSVAVNLAALAGVPPNE